MPVPPEVLFDRFFRTEVPATTRQSYKSKQDLDVLEPALRSLLVSIQESLNEALRSGRKDIAEHVDHGPFHFDYVDSTVPNAVAFVHNGYSFIGVTMPLINKLLQVCARLSRSEAITTVLGVRLPPEERDALHVVLLRTQLNFVVCHEYTHHVHGHQSIRESGGLFNEILEDHPDADMVEEQAREMDADGYASYLVLFHLFAEGRAHSIRLLKADMEPDRIQDELLFDSFVAAVGGFLFVSPPTALDSTRVYNLVHPPQAARMDNIMKSALSWCSQNRPRLQGRMSTERFQMIMNAVAQATWGMNGGSNWGAQGAFLQSREGSEYLRKLQKRLKAHVQSLGRNQAI